MSNVIELTRQLGTAILESEEYKGMQIAEDRMNNDPAAAALKSGIDECTERLNSYFNAGSENFEEINACRKELENFKQMMNDLPSVSAAMSARQAFSGLMNRVNQVLEFTIMGEVSSTEGGCSGSCSSCKGCGSR